MADSNQVTAASAQSKDIMVASDKLKIEAEVVRNSRINWQSYFQGQMITKEDFAFIQEFDLAPNHRKSQMLDTNGGQCVRSILNLLRHIPKDQNLRYILTIVDDLLEEDPNRVELFTLHAKKNKSTSLASFLPLLNRPDPFIAHQAARILAKMCVNATEVVEESELDYFISWIKSQMEIPSNEYLQNVAVCLMKLLRVDAYRQKFVQKEALNTLMSVLNKKIGFQLQYQLINCLWLLTFNQKIAEEFVHYPVVPVLAKILSEALKDKVIRIILAFFKNMIVVPEDKDVVSQYLLAMIQCKVLKTVDLLQEKDFDDIELKEDLEFLVKKLEESVLEVSSFDEYSQELRSHRLEWSPVHKSDKFWRENASRLNENNFELLRILASLLNIDGDPLVLAVAAHDIGEYVRCHPRGRKVLEQLGCKTRVMQLMLHSDSSVKYNALLATQKIMVDNWEYIGKPVAAK